MYTIRLFNNSDADYEGITAVGNADWPDEPTTAAMVKFNDSQRNPKFLHQRYVVERAANDGEPKRIVAVGGAWESAWSAAGGTWESAWSHVPGKYGMSYQLHPDFANQGIAERLYDHIITFLNARDLKPTILQTFIREDSAERVGFYTDRGFEVGMRESTSALDVTDYDFTPFAGLPEQVAASGIEILTLPELQQREPDWMQKFYDIETTIDNDLPMPDAPTPPGIEEFAKIFKHPNFLPDAHFFALDGNAWVGLSTLWKDDVLTDKLWVGLTGTLRSHRRRGIATVLKLKTFEFAIAYGAKIIETGNEENNPMYALNMKLGFAPKPAWLTLRKNLK